MYSEIPLHNLRIKSAFEFSNSYFGSMKRDTGENILWHPIRMIKYGFSFALDKERFIVDCLLHDVIEDTSCSYSDLIKEFGAKIANDVKILSLFKIPEEELPSDKKEKWSMIRECKQKYLSNVFNSDFDVRLVKFVDRIDNLDTFEGMIKRSRKVSLVKYIAETEQFIEQCDIDELKKLLIEKSEKAKEMINK